MAYSIERMPERISIGRETETGVTDVMIDCGAWVSKWPGMTLHAIYTPEGGAPYILQTETDGSVLVWHVTDADTATPGTGLVEIVGETYGRRKVSAMVKVYVAARMGGTVGETPEAAQPWVDRVVEAAERITGMKVQAETLAAGSGATAAWDGEQGLLTIGVPKGEKGEKGPQGDKGEPGNDAVVDATLTKSGQAADAKVTGDIVSQLKDDLAVLANETLYVGTIEKHGKSVEFASKYATKGVCSISDNGTVEKVEDITNLKSDTISAYINSNIQPNGTSTWAFSDSSKSIRLPIEQYSTYKIGTTANVSIFKVGLVVSENLPQPNSYINTFNTVSQTDNREITITTGRDYKYLVIQFGASSFDDAVAGLYVRKVLESYEAEAATEFDVTISEGNNHFLTTADSMSISWKEKKSTIIAKTIPNTGNDVSDSINSDVSNGGIVVFLPGVYMFSKTIKIPSNTHIIGNGAVFKLIDNGSNLTPHEWYYGSTTMPSYYPYFTTDSCENITIDGITVLGSESYSDNLHVGIAVEESKFVQIKNCIIERVNYFPDRAPERPSGQFRTGWNIGMLRSKHIEIGNCTVRYGAYECVRVGTKADNVFIHDCFIEYGWRTGLQIIEGCHHVTVERCVINQDDFGKYDTNACITLHPSSGNHCENIKIAGCKLTGKLFNSSSGGAGIFSVDAYIDGLVVEDTIIDVDTVYGMEVRNNTHIERCVIKSPAKSCIFTSDMGKECHIRIVDSNFESTDTAIVIQSESNKPVSFDVRGNVIQGAGGIYVSQQNTVVNRKSAIKDNTITTTREGIHIAYSSNEYKLLSIEDNCFLSGTYAIRIYGVGKAVITGNNVSLCDTGIVATGTSNIVASNITA